jgi:hypothetical protein
VDTAALSAKAGVFKDDSYMIAAVNGMIADDRLRMGCASRGAPLPAVEGRALISNLLKNK